jgi:hypothetical protein
MASIEDRSTPGELRVQVRWRDGRMGQVRSYTFRGELTLAALLRFLRLKEAQHGAHEIGFHTFWRGMFRTVCS